MSGGHISRFKGFYTSSILAVENVRRVCCMSGGYNSFFNDFLLWDHFRDNHTSSIPAIENVMSTCSFHTPRTFIKINRRDTRAYNGIPKPRSLRVNRPIIGFHLEDRKSQRQSETLIMMVLCWCALFLLRFFEMEALWGCYVGLLYP